MKDRRKPTHTRSISPKLGGLGLLGLLGFAGFLPKALDATDVLTAPSFFFFFAFFGFFGFYYEGKMSNTFMDERFQANAYRAAATANKISLALIVGVSIAATSLLRLSAYDLLGVLAAVIGLGFGLSVFLQQYLLYRLENGE